MNKNDINQFTFNKQNTFCISLESANDRWQRMQTRFDFFNMTVTRFLACDKEADLNVPFADYLSIPQKCCAQSHINIYKMMRETNMEYALILEDDACFDLDWLNKLNLIHSNLSFHDDKDWHAIFLNASEPITPINSWVLCQEQYLTAGYVISLNGANYILNYFENCFYSSDWMTTRLQLNGHCYSYFAWLIIQEGKESSIGSNYTADRKKVEDCLRAISYSLDNYI